MSDTSDWTPVKIASPLPLDVATTLISLIGAAYPSAVIDTTGSNRDTWGGHEYALSMRIDPAERAKRVAKKQAAELVEDATDLEVLGFDDGWLATSTPEELGLYLGSLAHEMFTKTEGAINYVEWQVHTGDGERYVLSVAKSKGQTPDAMRKKAEARVAELEAKLDEASA